MPYSAILAPLPHRIFPSDGTCFYEPCLNLIDSDGDGVIDVEELLELIENLGCTGPDCFGDFNGDLIVDLNDLLLFLV